MGQQENDNYPTPDLLASSIIRTVAAWRPQVGLDVPDIIIEPSCGAGAFIKAARAAWPESFIIGGDIVPSYEEKAIQAGANAFYQGPLEDTFTDVFSHAVALPVLETKLVVGNPPFSHAQRHIEILMSGLDAGEWLVFLLRLGFMGSVVRANTFWNSTGKQQRFLIPIAGRPSYVKFKNVEVIETVDGVDYSHRRRKKLSTTDNSEYGVFVFEKGYSGPCIKTDPLIWKGDTT